MFKSIGIPYFSCVGLPNMEKTLGERVRLALDGPPKKSQAALARACRVSPPSVNDWITGKSKTIEGANLLNAAAFLNVNPRWLAEGVGPMRPNSDEPDQNADREAVRVGLGMRLASARKNRNLTPGDVAEKFGITERAVSIWEAGGAVPDALTLRALAKLYDTSADALLWEDSLSPDAMKFAAEYDNLTDKQQRTFRTVWMAFVADSAGDGEVEEKMQATKEFKYAKKSADAPQVVKPEGGKQEKTKAKER